MVLSIFVVVNLLYFTNLIPPIPLSLKDAGVFHSVIKKGEGSYEVIRENKNWREYFLPYDNFHRLPDESVYVWSAVFSPTGLDTVVIHQWQYWDERAEEWLTESEIRLAVRGGRDRGFRTYSYRSDLEAGQWRVNIQNARGQKLGHVRFKIIPVSSAPELTSAVK